MSCLCMVIKMTNRYAIIEDNTVLNVVVAEPEFAIEKGWVECPIASPGWGYINDVFIEPEPLEISKPIEQKPLTKEDLLNKLNILQQQIASLSE